METTMFDLDQPIRPTSKFRRLSTRTTAAESVGSFVSLDCLDSSINIGEIGADGADGADGHGFEGMPHDRDGTSEKLHCPFADTIMLESEGDIRIDEFNASAATVHAANGNKLMETVMEEMETMKTLVVQLANKVSSLETQLVTSTAEYEASLAKLETKLDTNKSKLTAALMNHQTQLEEKQIKIDGMKLQLKKSDMRQSSLQARCKTLEGRCTELENTVLDHQLIFEFQDWEYGAETGAEIAEEAYWTQDQHRDKKYAKAMTKLMTTLKDYSYRLRGGEPVGKLILASPQMKGQPVDSNQTPTLLSYDPVLLPHWQEFADALQQSQKFLHRRPHTIEYFSISNIELPPVVLEVLSPALEELCIKRLILEGNHGGKMMMKELVLPCIENNSNLKKLKLVNNLIQGRKEFTRLSELVRYHPSLEDLTIQNCYSNTGSSAARDSDDKVDEEAFAYLISMCKNLKRINLSQNNFGSKLPSESDSEVESSCCASLCVSSSNSSISVAPTPAPNAIIASLSRLIHSNPPIEYLNLKQNSLTNSDITIISKSLRKNTHLQLLDLGGNEGITHSKDLLEAVMDQSSLNSAHDSNHTCHIRGMENVDGLVGINGMLGPNSSRKQKIYSVIASKYCEGELISLLDDVPSQFIPEVWESVYQYSMYYYNQEENASGHDQRQHAGGGSESQKMYVGACASMLSTESIKSVHDNIKSKEDKAAEGLITLETRTILYDVLRKWMVPELAKHC